MHRRLIALAWESRQVLIIAILSGFGAGLLTIAQAWLLSSTINAVFLERQTMVQVWGWLRLILVILSARCVLVCLNEVTSNELAVGLKTGLRERLYLHMQSLGPAFSRGQRTGELVYTVGDGIEALDAYYSQYLPQLILSVLVPASILLFIIPVDLLSAIIMLVTAPLIPFFMIMIGKSGEALTGKQFRTLSLMASHFFDSLQGLTTLKIFGRSKSHAEQIAKVNEQYRDATMAVLRITFLSALALELLSTLSIAIIAVEVGLRLLYNSLGFQEAFTLLILAPEFYQPLRRLGAQFHAGMAGTTAAKRIFEILDNPAMGNQPSCTSARSSWEFTSITFDNISFIYPGETRPALNAINYSLQRGRQIALVGPTGAGKSTLVNLLLGFIQPTSGRIIIDKDARIPICELRKEIAWMSQRPYLFHDTIEANLRLAKPAATKQELESAVRQAHLLEWIESLPEKYQTVIGESGARLSAGEAQLLAVARAFLKDAPFLILDETTSNLDPETESMIEESTRNLMKGRTILTIAHRLNTVYQADEILVMDHGKIIERGRHADLVAIQCVYAELVHPSYDEETRWDNIRSAEVVEAREWSHVIPRPIDPVLNHAPRSGVEGHEWSTFIRLLSFLEGSWKRIWSSVLLSALAIGSSTALMGSAAWLISTAALQPSIGELGIAIVAVRFFGISRGVFRYLERLVSHDVTFRLLARLRLWFYEKLEPLAPARLMEFHSGDILARIISDVNLLEGFYVRVIAPSLTAFLVAVGLVIFLSVYDMRLAILLSLCFIFLGGVLPLTISQLSLDSVRKLVGQKGILNNLIADGVQGLADILVFDAGEKHARQFAAENQKIAKLQKRFARWNALNIGIVNGMTNLAVWLVLCFVIPDVSSGRISGVMLGTLALTCLAAFEAVQALPTTGQLLKAYLAAANRLFEIVDAQPCVTDNPKPMHLPDPLSKPVLEISNLSFSYPYQSSPALDRIYLKVNPGNRVAIVGPTGAGKSTLVNLLLRFWDYHSGEICLNGISLKSYQAHEIRKTIGVLTQSTYFFNTSIHENLRLAKPNATRAEMQAAAAQAQVQEFIRKLPAGYDTTIGEQGLRLSGGERQLLAIARLLLRDAPIVILDEPTANLDPLTESRVLETFFAAFNHKTVILITHRLLSLEAMDEILVMNHGCIVEHGSHFQLLNNRGTYHRLMNYQNRILMNGVSH